MNYKHFLNIINELISENDRLKAQVEELQQSQNKVLTPVAVWRLPSPGPDDMALDSTVLESEADAESITPSSSIDVEYKEMVDPVTGVCKCGYKSRRKTTMSLTGYMVHRKRVKQHKDYLSSQIPKSS